LRGVGLSVSERNLTMSPIASAHVFQRLTQLLDQRNSSTCRHQLPFAVFLAVVARLPELGLQFLPESSAIHAGPRVEGRPNALITATH
jgi:hypothetical protein